MTDRHQDEGARVERAGASDAPAYEITLNGYTARGWHGSLGSNGRIQITHETRGIVIDREYAGYKIWNVAAHFPEIVADLEEQTSGAAAARSTSARESR